MSLTKIQSVDPHSPARRAGVRPGEILTHINGRPIADVLDYKFYSYDPRLELTLAEEDGLYFLTARGKSFYSRLMARPFAALTGRKGRDTLSSVAISLRGPVRNIGTARLEEIFQKNPYRKWLRHILVNHQIIALYLAVLVRQRRQHDHRHIGFSPDLFAQRKTVQFRQQNVQNYQICSFLSEETQSFQTIIGRHCPIPFIFQKHRQHLCNIFFIFYD